MDLSDSNLRIRHADKMHQKHWYIHSITNGGLVESKKNNTEQHKLCSIWQQACLALQYVNLKWNAFRTGEF